MTMETPNNIGVINPFALAEVTLKRKIDWKRVSDPKNLLEQTLGMPYEKLFDPKFDSPLYAGVELKPNTHMLQQVEKPIVGGAYAAMVDAAATAIWVDPGTYFEEAAELSDPVQGAVGDCYFIAALSSVAWARTYLIAQRTRATGLNQPNFVDMIEFYENGKPVKVEVTELLPLMPPSNTFVFARSAEAGEIWPAVYEKAYAKWRTKDTTDQPDIRKIAGGDPVAAAAQLTGLTPSYFSNEDLATHDIWQKVRQFSISMKTFHPMVAWTYGSAPSPDVNYNNAHLAANHAYSILGWQYVNNTEYIVLRNPWGTYDATLNVDGGTWIAWDAPYYGGPGWWRPINMATNDGIFALSTETFKKYFAGFGLVQ